MNKRRYAAWLSIVLFTTVLSCNNAQDPVPASPDPLTPGETIELRLDSLKNSLQEGDLVVRLADDFISDRIRFLASRDPSYSHAGIVVFKNNVPVICHIYPENTKQADTVKYHPVDTFFAPEKTIRCAVYRYELSSEEKRSFVQQLDGYHQRSARFDEVYDLGTDDAVYCSEMIYKSLKQATGGRISCKVTHIPEKMLPMVMGYFKIYKKPKAYFTKLDIMSIDNLYLTPGCSLVMKLDLKTSP